MSLDSLQNGLSNALTDTKSVFSTNTAAVIGGSVLGGALIGASVVGLAKRKTKRRSKAKKTKKRSKKRKTKYARTAGKRKDTSRKRIRMTKSGQPYIILASGKARFIKKSSARNSRKRKGGRY